jgi:hypothetical protein
MNNETVTIKEYLDRKGVKIVKETGDELVVRCVFDNCDADSNGDEAHLYFSKATSQYDCKKCHAKGNIVTLAQQLGDQPKDVFLNPKPLRKSAPSRSTLNPNIVEKCNREMPERIRTYLNNRGITDEIIRDYSLGFGSFYERNWITIPIKDEGGKFSFLKLRMDPEDDTNPDKSKVFPFGKEAQIYGWDTLQETEEKIVIAEGEFDRLILLSKGIPAVTSTGGAGTFKREWLLHFENICNIYVCYDNDEAGRKGADRVLNLFLANEKLDSKLFRITLPEEVGEHGDITDYFIKLSGNSDDLFDKFAKEYPERPAIDISNFTPMFSNELIGILGLTVKKDETNKLITFLGELSAFTEDSQLNISYIAPSSTGKSYIPVEISGLFPLKDIITVGYCSPTAFFHDRGKYNAEKNECLIDLSRKVLIFLDQPHTLLLQHLRPLLSHDTKEISIKITDKNQRGGHQTKNILLRGYPAVVFCTAGFKLDEQEATRFLLLSPETNQEKIREGVRLKIRKETDRQIYQNWIESDPRRQLLKQRIEAIKQEHIEDVKLGCPEKIEEMFFEKRAMLKPKHQRDIGRIIAIIKCFAILNLWWREREGTIIIANEDDVIEAFAVWERIAESQELNIPPYLYSFYYEIILPVWKDKNETALNRKDVMKKHSEVYGRPLNDWFLRQQVLPVLENSGLISQEPDPDDKRKMLIYPVAGIEQPKEQYSELGGGVNDETQNHDNLLLNFQSPL